MHQCFLNFFVGLLKKILNTKILLASMKTLTILKLVPKATSLFFSGLLSLSLVGFIHVISSYWTGEKSAEIDMSWAVFNFQNHRRVQEQVLQSEAGFWMSQKALWRGLLEGLSKLVSVFKEASKNLAFDFLNNKDKTKFKNHQRIYRKYWFNLIGHQKEYSSHDIVPSSKFIIIYVQAGDLLPAQQGVHLDLQQWVQRSGAAGGPQHTLQEGFTFALLFNLRSSPEAKLIVSDWRI